MHSGITSLTGKLRQKSLNNKRSSRNDSSSIHCNQLSSYSHLWSSREGPLVVFIYGGFYRSGILKLNQLFSSDGNTRYDSTWLSTSDSNVVLRSDGVGVLRNWYTSRNKHRQAICTHCNRQVFRVIRVQRSIDSKNSVFCYCWIRQGVTSEDLLNLVIVDLERISFTL